MWASQNILSTEIYYQQNTIGLLHNINVRSYYFFISPMKHFHSAEHSNRNCIYEADV